MTSTTRRLLGALMLAVPFGLLGALTARETGWMMLILAWGGTAVAALWVAAAVALIVFPPGFLGKGKPPST